MAIDDIGSVRLRVQPDLDQAALRRQIAKIKTPKLNLGVRITTRSVNAAVKEVNAKKTAALKLNVKFSRAQIARELKKATTGMAINLRVKGNGKNGTALFDPKGDAVLARQRILIAERTAAKMTQIEAQTAATRERSNQTLLARQRLAEQTHLNRLQLLHERHRLMLERRNAKPIFIRYLSNIDKVAKSFAPFQRVAFQSAKVIGAAWLGVNAIIGVGTVAAVVAATKQFAAAEEQAARAAAVFASGDFINDKAIREGVGNSIQSFREFGKEYQDKIIGPAQRTALATLFDTTEVVEGFKSMAQAGIPLGTAIDQVGTIAKFAQNEAIDLDTSVQLLATGFQAAGFEFDTQGQKLLDLADKFTFVANASTTTAEEVAQAFSRRAVASFRSYGASADDAVDQTLQLVDLFAKVGVRGLTAGVQIGILTREINQSAFSKAPDMWKKYGIEIGRTKDGKVVPMTKTLAELAQKFDEVRQSQGAAGTEKLRDDLKLTAKSFGNILQILPAINKESKKLGGPQGFVDAANAFTLATGSVERQASLIQDTLSFQFDALLNSIQNLGYTFGKTAGPIITGFLKTLNAEGTGLAERLGPSVERLGRSFARLATSSITFLSSARGAAAFADIRKGIGDSIKAIGEFGKAFSGQFGGNRNFFELVAAGIQKFGELSLKYLPKVGALLGKAFNFISEHPDLAANIGKVALSLALITKALSLMTGPLLTISALFGGGSAAAGGAGLAAGLGGAEVAAGGLATGLVATLGPIAAIGGAIAVAGYQLKGFIDRAEMAWGSWDSMVQFSLDETVAKLEGFARSGNIVTALMSHPEKMELAGKGAGNLFAEAFLKTAENAVSRPERFNVADILKRREEARAARGLRSNGTGGFPSTPGQISQLTIERADRLRKTLNEMFNPTTRLAANQIANAIEKFGAIEGLPNSNKELGKFSSGLRDIASTASGNRFLIAALGDDYKKMIDDAATSKDAANKILSQIGQTKPGRQFLNEFGLQTAEIKNKSRTELVTAGQNLVEGLMDGIKPYLTVGSALGKLLGDNGEGSILGWIRAHKGPVAYDRTVLVPAGQGIMQGLVHGLRDGFNPVKNFLSGIAPSMEEFVPTSLLSGRVADYLIDVAVGKKPNIADFFGGLVPDIGNLAGGAVDSKLGFLHKTLSLADTRQMAASLAKTFGLQVTSLFRPGAITSSGNISDHSKGFAADISGSVSATDRMVASIKPLFGSIFKQIIWHNKDVNRGYNIPGHENHAHVAWLPGGKFSLNSGAMGKALGHVFGITSPVKGSAGGPFGSLFAQAAATFGVPANFLKAVAKAESGFNPRAHSGAGAAGLMQLMPATFKSLGVGGNILDPKSNIFAGAKYLSQQLNRFHSPALALAAYNAGPGNASYALGHFGETMAYVKKVLGFLKSFGGFRAAGGPAQVGRSYGVNELGPEMFMPQKPGFVMSNDRLERMLRALESGKGAMGASYQPVYNLQTNSDDPGVILAMIEARDRKRIGQVAF